MQFQPERPHSFLQIGQKTLGFFPVLKSQHGIVSVSYDDHITARHLLPPCVCPDIEYVMQVMRGQCFCANRLASSGEFSPPLAITPGLEHRPNQAQHSAAGYSPGHER